MSSGRRIIGLLVVAAVGLGPIAACSESGKDPLASPSSTTTRAPVAPPSTSATSTTTTVPLPVPVSIAWRPCGAFDCATVQVPIDYTNHAAGTLGIAITRRPAGDPGQRIGSLIMNPGGPGSSGVRRVQRGFQVSPEVAARFDIIGFDPRGVGASRPIRCGESVAGFRNADLGPDSPEEIAALEAAAQAVADECAATEGPLLAHLGTVDVAHDVEVIRRALGEAQVSFLGISYGTFIGLLWAEAYPTSVRAMVLDGVADPSAGGETTSPDQIRAIDGVLRAIDRSCVTDPACVLRPDGGVQAAYDEVARRVEAGAGSGSGVGPTQVTYALFMATYGTERWPSFLQALRSALDGRYGDLRALADDFTSLVPYATFAIVTCLDTPHPVGVEAWRADAARATRVSRRFGPSLANELLPCAFFPQSTYRPHDVVAKGTPDVLVVGSTGDAATPYSQAVEVARNLDRGVLLTVNQDGHVALGDSPCATDAITRYLIDLTKPTAEC